MIIVATVDLLMHPIFQLYTVIGSKSVKFSLIFIGSFTSTEMDSGPCLRIGSCPTNGCSSHLEMRISLCAMWVSPHLGNSITVTVDQSGGNPSG